MADWNPGQYLEFAAPRLRPALDLLARVPLDDVDTVYDLGCGPGNVTPFLAARWPAARMVGVDSSAGMLEKARATGAAAEWVQADLATWIPEAPARLLYSNAVFHWLDDHAAVFPRLMSLLAPGGVLAVQMPHNHGAPSYTHIRDAAAAGPWRDAALPVYRPMPVADPSFYYDVLAPLCGTLEIWETEYLQVLEGDNPVVEYTRSTGLRPVYEAVPAPHQDAFMAEYRRLVAASYPPRADGKTLFPFRRLFIVATAPA
ncbi:MAG: methyltransferase domain-containing protein [Hyphomicrobiales bacterium]|nr:methyltransferase domain-containing protein [Hyphomicrobiales bacterium]